jgi:hypothetical protein
MNFLSSNLSTNTYSIKIKKSIRLAYYDIPIPNDYKFNYIKVCINDLINNNLYFNSNKIDCSFLIPVNSSLGYRTIMNSTSQIVDTHLTISNNRIPYNTLNISFRDMNNNLINFTDNWLIHFMIL